MGKGSTGMTINLPDPKSPPSKMDQQALGCDCYRHPLVGNVCAQNGTPAGVQARNFLGSLYHATEHQIAGRPGDMSKAKYLEWLHKLDAWEKAGNQVNMPPVASDAQHPKLPAITPQNPTPAEREQTSQILAVIKQRRKE